MVEKDDYSDILDYHGNQGMGIALVTGLLICLTGIGLYGTELCHVIFDPDFSFQPFSFIKLV